MHTWDARFQIHEDLTPTDFEELLKAKLKGVYVEYVTYVPKTENADNEKT